MTRTRHLARTLLVLFTGLGVPLGITSAANAQYPTFPGGADASYGSPRSGAWQNGAPGYSVAAYSPAGIQSILVTIDGRPVQRQEPCGAGCPTTATLTTNLPTTSYPDGEHQVVVSATDAGGASNQFAWTLRVDNTPPAPPGGLGVVGRVGWRAQPELQASWANPAQRFAPLYGVHYQLCPAEADSGNAAAKARCVQDTIGEVPMFWAPGPMPTSLPAGLRLPGPGLWNLRVWFGDSAGNQNPDAAAVVSGLGYDPTPPEVKGFVAQDPNDPARVTVAASDDGAPITGGSIEVRRRGRNAWRPLPTEVRAGGLSALVDDETLRRGRYTLRATVVNAAGLQQGTSQGADGSVKSLELPIRTGSRVVAGRRVGKVCRREAGRRRCRFKLARRVPVELGRPVTLRARLSVAHRPIADQPLEIWERIRVAGGEWKHVGTIESDRHGGVRYKAPPGPARLLRLRFPGSAQVRGDNATIRIDVQAKTSIRVSRRNVINGEYVTFRGKLKGRPIPAQGALVELQVRSRGKWRTFAQPRADARGAWRYQYRFETVTGGAHYRFRARIRRQAGYPYATGSSRPISVRVHGL